MNLLDTIFESKRRALNAKQAILPLREIQARVKDLPPTRGFAQAIRSAGRTALVAEAKKATPSAGVLRSDFDPVEIAHAYESAGAEAMSVLTDIEFFQGSPSYLAEVRAAVPMPILRKDFTVDAYDIWEARLLGADAVLLIVYGLADFQIREYRELAESLGMDALVEVHSEEEVARAESTGATLIGVNNRDLTTFKTSIEVGERVIPCVDSSKTIVAESAIRDGSDVNRLVQAGAHAVLIGTTFCRADDIEAKVREVMRWKKPASKFVV